MLFFNIDFFPLHAAYQRSSLILFVQNRENISIITFLSFIQRKSEKWKIRILEVWHKAFCDTRKLEGKINSSQRAILKTEMMVAFQRGYCRQNRILIINWCLCFCCCTYIVLDSLRKRKWEKCSLPITPSSLIWQEPFDRKWEELLCQKKSHILFQITFNKMLKMCFPPEQSKTSSNLSYLPAVLKTFTAEK